MDDGVVAHIAPALLDVDRFDSARVSIPEDDLRAALRSHRAVEHAMVRPPRGS